MSAALEYLVLPLLALASIAYLALAVIVARSSPQSIVGYLLFLIGIMMTGNMLSHGADDLMVFGAGRVLAYFGAGFMPVTFYAIYRHYTDGLPGRPLLVALSVIPAATTVLALTNSMHYLIWEPVYTEAGLEILQRTDKVWFVGVHAPFAYGLFGFTVIALASRLPSIAPAHRRTMLMLTICALIPFVASVTNTFLGVGDPDTPVLSISLALLLPVFAYLSLRLRVYEFSPVAYQTLFDHVRDAIFVLDNDERIICANRHATELLGQKQRELLGRRLWEEFPEVRSILKRAIEMDLTQTLMLDDSHAYEISVAPLQDPAGRTQGTVVACRDVTERRRALSKLANSEHLVRTLIETSSNGILRFGRDEQVRDKPFRCIFANRAAAAFLGRHKGELEGMPLDALESIDPKRLFEQFDADGTAKIMTFEREIDSDSARGWFRIVAEPIGDDISVTVVDITQRKLDEDKMLEDAVRDPLTGVYNRRGFEQRATACIRDEEHGAVLYLDLNQFKSVNDRFGHQAGDALLKAFANRLERCLRSNDILGRLGGDEFAIVLPGVSLDESLRIADRFVATASDHYIIQGVEMRCTASVGIALMPHHGEDLWHLISVADRAMYNAKQVAGTGDADTTGRIEVAIAS